MTPDWAFLIPAAPICLWVIYSDLSAMRIPNVAVLALIGVFTVVGLLTLPIEAFAWRWVQLVIVIAITMVGALLGQVGMGDVKFAGAMALFIRPDDAVPYIWLFCIVTFASLALHRLVRVVPALRAGMPDWRSWDHPGFPMGVPLAAALLIYLAL